MRPRVFLALLGAFMLALMASLPAGAAAPVRVGIAYDGSGPGDNSFNDLARAGALEAKAEYSLKLFEAAPTLRSGRELNRQSLLTSLAKRSSLVVAVGFLYEEAVGTVAGSNPRSNFALIDSEGAGGDNLLVATFAESEGSFLVGAAAAMKSDKFSFGFIGGVDIPVIDEFEEGYIAGVKYVENAAQVDVAYVSTWPDFGGFNDPEGAYAIAMGMYESGIDVIFHAAGNSGIGLFQAARDYSAASSTHVWAIGVDVDQYNQVGEDLKPFILTSMLKRVDVATYDIIRSQVEGTFTGGQQVWDLEANGVGYATSGGFLNHYVSALTAIEDGIKLGTIDVP
jgi:basic membrane protein A